jgi:hypothetical protein
MLGLPGIIQTTQNTQRLSGLDIVMGNGFGITTNANSLAAQRYNGVHENLFITSTDLAAIDTRSVVGTSSRTHGLKLTASTRCSELQPKQFVVRAGFLASSAALDSITFHTRQPTVATTQYSALTAKAS